jgi:hypothetical protein
VTRCKGKILTPFGVQECGREILFLVGGDRVWRRPLAQSKEETDPFRTYPRKAEINFLVELEETPHFVRGDGV